MQPRRLCVVACLVGRQSTRSLLLFMLVPQCCHLLIGCTLLVVGLATLARRRPVPPRRPHEATRLGVLAALYAVPASCVSASLAHEYWSREQWLQGHGAPSLWVFLLRLFMSLVVGVTAVVWVWSPKTVKAWRAVLRRFGPYKPAPVKCHPIQYYPQPQLPVITPRGRPPRRKKHRKHGSETRV
uniref:Frizzled/Smoothened 7TM domain-containing protein n=1 Tax=Timema genevievae TaxID=629358 RepID=A0A7R9K614_TIMGE|nr:unnamed protein product [Timema genevievae]